MQMYGSQWGSLHTVCFFTTSHMRICIRYYVYTSHMRICIRYCVYTSHVRIHVCIRYYKSHKNPYQVLQVTCAVSEHAMKSKVQNHYHPSTCTCTYQAILEKYHLFFADCDSCCTLVIGVTMVILKKSCIVKCIYLHLHKKEVSA